MPSLLRPKTQARVPARIRRRSALTASAESAKKEATTLIRLSQGWQVQALLRYRDTPECWNPCQYFGRAMERIRYFPAILDENGKVQESKDPRLWDLFNRIRSPGGAPGDLSELAGSYARLQQVIGDGLLTVTSDSGEEQWEYLSPMEMRLDPPTGGADEQQSYRRYRAPGVMPQELIEAPDDAFQALGDEARVWRLWRRHIEYSQWADSPIRPLLELYALLNRLTLAVYAEASSRAAQRGILFIPEEFSFTTDPAQDENPNEDPLMKEFQESLERAIANPGSAEAMSPYILRAPGVTQSSGGATPTADLIKWLAMGPADRYVEGEMWDKTISRIAGGLDFPKEMLTGIEDVSHWSAWFLDEVGFRQHTGPTVIRFCGDLASAYLRPAAINEGVANAERVVMGFDPSAAINHPDETGVVRDAHNALVISDAYYREKIGADEGDAPPPEELHRRIDTQIRVDPYSGQPARTETGASAPQASEETGKPGEGETPPPAGGRGGDTVKQPPSGTQKRPPGNKPPSPQPNMSGKVIGAAEMAVDRARELAGQRLFRRSQSCIECQEKTRGVPLDMIAATLGLEEVLAIIDGHATEASLVAGVGEKFAARLNAWGINGGWPEQLGQMVEQHALRTLYEEKAPALTSGFIASVHRALSED